MKASEMTPQKRKILTVLLATAAAIVLIVAVTLAIVLPKNGSDVQRPNDPVIDDNTGGSDNNDNDNTGGDDNTNGDNNDENSQGANTSKAYEMPVKDVSITNSYEFFYNKTLDKYYFHTGLDFASKEGEQVFAISDGTVTSINKDDVLTGTSVSILSADGITSVYSFIQVDDNLKVGDKVEQGDVIGTVAKANGEEYKDGEHLHLELFKDGKTVDPSLYLEIENK